MALIRYPGSKAKLADAIIGRFRDEMALPIFSNAIQLEYREPFFGAGAIGFDVLRKIDFRCPIWLNDADEDLVCMWQSVREHPRELINLVGRFKPTADAFYDFKERDGLADCSPVERGFRKLALHRMSMSGFGVMSGGPIGGKSQENARYTVDCRWNPERIKLDITDLSKLLAKFASMRITCGDFSKLVDGAGPRTFIYLDPPYYEKGPILYRHSMSDADHARLAESLRSTAASWALSYDDHEFVRRLYGWASIEEIAVRYSNAVTKSAVRPKNREVVITRKSA